MLKKYLILIICLFISALIFNIIQYPNNIVSGGIQGITIIINKYLNINPSIIILVISIIFYILSFIFLGKNKTYSSIVSTFVYPLFIKITSNINILFITNKILISVIIGLISGILVGIIYKNNLNNGGISIIVEIISKYSNKSIPIISFIINMLIVILGSITIDNKMFIYSLIVLFVNSLSLKIVLKKDYEK